MDATHIGVMHLDRLYDAAFDGNILDTILTVIHDALPDTGVLLYGQDKIHLNGNFILHRGLPAEQFAALNAGAGARVPWLERLWLQEPGVIYEAADDALVGTPNGAGAEAGGHEHVAGFVVSRQNMRQLVLEVRHARRKGPALRAQVRSLLDEALPHIIRAARISEMSRIRTVEEAQKSNLLELIGFPVFVIDAGARVHELNARAEMMAARMETLMVRADGLLQAVDPAAQAQIAEAVRDVSQGLRPRELMMALGQEGGAARQFVSIVRLGRVAQIGGGAGQGDRLAVVACDLAQPLDVDPDALSRAFGLSGREARLAVSLLGGNSMGETASKARVSKQTLRNQLCGIMRKTETSRQPELVALLTRMAMSNSCGAF